MVAQSQLYHGGDEVSSWSQLGDQVSFQSQANKDRRDSVLEVRTESRFVTSVGHAYSGNCAAGSNTAAIPTSD